MKVQEDSFEALSRATPLRSQSCFTSRRNFRVNDRDVHPDWFGYSKAGSERV